MQLRAARIMTRLLISLVILLSLFPLSYQLGNRVIVLVDARKTSRDSIQWETFSTYQTAKVQLIRNYPSSTTTTRKPKSKYKPKRAHRPNSYSVAQVAHQPVLDNDTPGIVKSIQELVETTTQSNTTDEDSDIENDDEAWDDPHDEMVKIVCIERENFFKKSRQNIWNYVFYFFYSLIFIIGLFGNSLTVRAMTKKRKKSNIDLFILSLAINDILVCIFNIPITPLYMLYYQHWIFGCTLCYVFTFAMCFSTYSSVFTLISIAMIRYQMVVYPHCSWMTRRTVLGIIGLVWILGLTMTVPYMVNIHLSKDSCDLSYCNESWPTLQGKLVFSVTTLLSKSVLPSVVVFFSYAAIYRKLKNRQKLYGSRKAMLTIAYPSAFPIAKSINAKHHHLKALTASNTVPYELNAAQQQQQLDNRLLMNGTSRGAQSLNNDLPDYLSEVPTNLNNPMHMSDIMIDKYNSMSDMGPELGQVFGDAFELCTFLAQNNSDKLQSGSLPPARISHQTTALIDGLVDEFVVHSSAGPQEKPKRPATSLGFLNKVVSATDLFRNDMLVRPGVDCQAPLKTNTILAIRENQVREKNQRLYQASRKLVIVVALFVACYLPVDIINLLYDYQTYMDTITHRRPSSLNHHYFMAAHLVCSASVCINPILYAWMSDNYRQELKNILPKWLIRKLFRD